MNELLLYSVEERIATISLNRPEKRNAFSPELVSELTQALLRAAEDEQVKVVILKAEGSVFSAGADLAYLQELSDNTFEENVRDSENLRKLFTTLYYLPKVVIAQVEGHAIAGGCGLATICDLTFAVPEALFGYTEVKLGFVPAIVSCFLVRQTSETIAKQILLSGDLFTAGEALAYNLINYIYPKDEIENEVRKYALKLCSETSGNSLMITKQLIGQTTNPGLEKSLNIAVQLNARVRESEDFKKGIAAFLQKEQIKW
ncbi:enoyl-CoA hydratase/isomerase family protein [Pedobacter antarcticus]|uniref:Methylglutaconyl-CoA hydratase n=2 Tax=Pedobacter antarcticus TaxID=34086 RepID=A0A081PHR3_9SPHI|nr:enoyl-CoA hydratase/isomerase family protein [Pedobacter antarcticus]KEQ30236.1 methylglutaconyl-CoA hydratase [Pedobacter antarcticus 4BY]SDL36207.1 methylglutaconyl-CoA hydratase [Pedobacter antarcticus]SFE52500.1 methylglutaconyl-CoA hydratase [Pedobacter antarcticus]